MLRALLLSAVLLGGCASSQHGVGVDMQKELVKPGVIERVTPIELDDSSGGAAGSIAGQVGGIYSGSMIGVILGSVVGGTVGSQAGIATKPGVELWVKLDDDGASVYVMQPLGKDNFKVGDPVHVLSKGNMRTVEAISAATIPAPQP